MKNLFGLIVLILFKVVIEVAYIHFINPFFGGYFILNISTIKLLESYTLAIILYTVIANWFGDLKRPSYIAIYMIFLNLIVPLLSYYALSNQPRGFIYMSCLSLLILILMVRFIKPLKIFYFKEGRTVTIVVFSAITLYVYLYLILTGGLSRINFAILEVYDNRSAYSQSMNIIMAYLLPWQGYIINLLLLSYFLFKKRYSLVMVVISAQLLLFGMTGFKSMLFAPVAVLALHYFLNLRKKRTLFLFLTVGLLLLSTFSFGLFLIQGDLLISSLFIRRLLFIPAQLHFLYYDFFQTQPLVFLSNSIFSGFIDNPFGNKNILHAISNYYFGQDMGINVGYIGNAYMNFGYFGIFIFSVLLGFVLKTLDSVSLRLPVSVTTSVIVIPSMILVNSGLLTVMLTHGLIFAIISIWLLNSWVSNQAEVYK